MILISDSNKGLSVNGKSFLKVLQNVTLIMMLIVYIQHSLCEIT